MAEEKPAGNSAKPVDSLDENTTDLITALTRGALGSAPIIGPIVAEMFTFAIPGQRVDRIVDVLSKMETRIEHIEVVVEKMNIPEGMDLTEDALVQASRALTEDRRLYIANLLRNSLTKEEIGHDQKKKLFNILSQLTDSEIIFLKNYGIKHTIGTTHPFVKKHNEILRPVTRAVNRSIEDSNRAAFQDNYKITLSNLRLVQPHGNTLTTTHLGNLLLDYIEVPDGTDEHE